MISNTPEENFEEQDIPDFRFAVPSTAVKTKYWQVQTGIYILFVHKTVLRNVQFFLYNRSKKCFFLSLVILLIINTLKSTRTLAWAYTYSRLVSNYLGHFPFFEEIPKSEFLCNFFCSRSVLGHLKSKCYS